MNARVRRRLVLFSRLPLGSQMTVVLEPDEVERVLAPSLHGRHRVRGTFAGLVDHEQAHPKLTLRASDAHGGRREYRFALAEVASVEDVRLPVG